MAGYDVWSPDNIKRFQGGMGLKTDGLVGTKTQNAMGTQKGANWLSADYNRGLAAANPIESPISLAQPRRYVTPGGMAGQGGNNWDGTYAQPTGLAGMKNTYNKYTGAGNYVNDAGYMTGGMGDYGSYNGVGIDQGAYDAIRGSGVTDGLVGPSAEGAGSNMWGKDGMVGGIAQGIQAGAGLANAYLGYKNYGLAKDMFGFEKAATNRNIANQAQLVNNEIQNAGEVGMSLAGNTMDPNARLARQAQLDTMKVSGSPVG